MGRVDLMGRFVHQLGLAVVVALLAWTPAALAVQNSPLICAVSPDPGTPM
jgi:hypothetical protein